MLDAIHRHNLHRWLGGVAMVAAILSVSAIAYALHGRHVAAASVFKSNRFALPWCDTEGMAGGSGPCMVHTPSGSIPLPLGGVCPGAYEIWRYNLRRPAICVRRA
jgi:hypothetical protein